MKYNVSQGFIVKCKGIYYYGDLRTEPNYASWTDDIGKAKIYLPDQLGEVLGWFVQHKKFTTTVDIVNVEFTMHIYNVLKD